MSGDAGVGALIGSGVGAIAGGLVGAGLDENDRRNEARIAAATAQPVQPPLSVADVIHMSQSGVADDVIIATIRQTGSCFDLPAGEIVALHQQGVSDRVLQAMIDAKGPRTIVKQAPVVYEPTPVYVVEPRPRVVIGFGPRRWHHHRHCW